MSGLIAPHRTRPTCCRETPTFNVVYHAKILSSYLVLTFLDVVGIVLYIVRREYFNMFHLRVGLKYPTNWESFLTEWWCSLKHFFFYDNYFSLMFNWEWTTKCISIGYCFLGPTTIFLISQSIHHQISLFLATRLVLLCKNGCILFLE